MLSLLALSIVARTHPPVPYADPITVKDAVRWLQTNGFDYVPGGQGRLMGKATYRGATIDFDLSPYVPDGEKGPEPFVGFMSLSIEIPVGLDVPKHEFNGGFGPRTPDSGVLTTPHLGRTVTLRQDIYVKEVFEPKRILTSLQRFWADGAAYAKQHRGAFEPAPLRDWSLARFPDAFVIDQADEPSFERAAASWRFRQVSEWIEGPSLMASGYEVDGVNVAVKTDRPFRSLEGQAYVLTANVRLPGSIDDRAWARAHAKDALFDQFYGAKPGIVVARQWVDVTKGLSLGDLRRRVEGFAASVKALQASIREAP